MSKRKKGGLEGVRGLYQKRGWFYYQPPTPDDDSSRPKAVALKTRDLMEALELLGKNRDERAFERAVTAGTLKEVLPKYYAAKSHDAPATKRCREQILDAFMKDVGNPKASEIDEKMIDRWRTTLASRCRRLGNPKRKTKTMTNKRAAAMSRNDADITTDILKDTLPSGLSGSTIKSYTITLRAFVNWLRNEGILRSDPMSKLKKQTQVAKTRQQEFYTEVEREALLAAEANERLRLILHLGFFAGLREGEMLAMTPDWIWISPDGTRGMITVQETRITYSNGSAGVWRPKTRQMRSIPMHTRLLEFLKNFPLHRPFVLAPHKPHWPEDEKKSKRFDSKRALHALVIRAEVRRIGAFHVLRHSFATHLAMKGVSLATIAKLLGDSLKVTEDHYVGYAPSKTNPLEIL